VNSLVKEKRFAGISVTPAKSHVQKSGKDEQEFGEACEYPVFLREGKDAV
jgi:hypothetical protein